jgi:predicted nucleic-acid-binding Zn-ribbon protein
VNTEVNKMDKKCKCGSKKTEEEYMRLVTGQVDGPEQSHIVITCVACGTLLSAQQVDIEQTPEE